MYKTVLNLALFVVGSILATVAISDDTMSQLSRGLYAVIGTIAIVYSLRYKIKRMSKT